MRRTLPAFVVGALLVGSLVGTVGFVWAAPPAIGNEVTAQGPQPYVDSISVRPDNGPGGTEVRVRGHIDPRDPRCPTVSIIFFDHAGIRTLLRRVPAGDIDLTANIPLGAALGLGNIQARPWLLVNHRCMEWFPGAHTPFTVTNGMGIFGFTPRKGGPGTPVTITGIRFTGVTAVKFNGTPSVFSVDSDSQITASAPAGATTGPIEVDKPAGPVILSAISGPDFVVCVGAIC